MRTPAYAREAMGISFLAANAGKESIALDLKHARRRRCSSGW